MACVVQFCFFTPLLCLWTTIIGAAFSPYPAHPCRELGKVMTGKLVVVTPDRQEAYLVRGKQPAYTPIQPSDLPSGTYLSATTASSRAKGAVGSSSSSSSAGVTAGPAKTRQFTTAGSNSSSRQDGAQIGSDLQLSSGQEVAASRQQQAGKQNYLRQNIKAAAAGGAGKVSSSSSSSPSKTKAWTSK